MSCQGRCSLCHEVRLVSVSRKTGEPCCIPCYKKHHQPQWRCVGCRKMKTASIVADVEAGTRLCQNCYARQTYVAICYRCGKTAAATCRDSGDQEPMCKECFKQHGPKGPTAHQRAALVAMQKLARERGGWCLSDQYESAKTHLRWRCQHMHQWDARPACVKQGTWCPVCAGFAPIIPGTIEEMHALAAERGGQCLSTDYLNCYVKLRWRCSEGHVWVARPASVKTGQWCPVCSPGRRISIKDMHAIAQERGGECLSTEYVRLNEPLRWRCGKGHEWTSPASSVRSAGTWCPICAGSPRSELSDLQVHARDRGGECLADEYRDRYEDLPWRCKAGHTWEAAWFRVQTGAWCPSCQRERTRPRLTLAVMHVYAARFGGQCLSDRYVNSGTKLMWRCAEGHVFEALQTAVAAGHWCGECGRNRKGSLDGLKAVARDRGGECLAHEYIGNGGVYRWRCAEGHEWSAGARSVKRGIWCPLCSAQNLRELEAIEELAGERGGVCISRVHMNSQTEMIWRCAAGHEWEAVPAVIKAGTWCPVCAVGGGGAYAGPLR